ncbi:hypothetical protein OG897_13740 [Streptomyces sp. NBC_00237]|uniref:hypothetical protein n=1 Tax=Streptomyces sp. NBC_00237 TaxID=2975687 RepID=UPI002256D27A|nr:hypothetical protein [Streptomyces sp. NBC_00237]MCX5202506.1 hypothetical protein [Streptomyces sp. NBC_00237]
MTIVNIKLRWNDGDIEAPYDDVDLTRLTPRARSVAEAIAQTSLRTATNIWLEHDTPIRDATPDWGMWHTEEEAALPERRPWRGWARYPAASTVDPHDYLETEARKIPPDWHVLGTDTDHAVPSKDAGAADTGMTRDMVLTYLRERGRPIGASTWTGYVARQQAPRPSRHVGRTPLWERQDIDDWLSARS